MDSKLCLGRSQAKRLLHLFDRRKTYREPGVAQQSELYAVRSKNEMSVKLLLMPLNPF